MKDKETYFNILKFVWSFLKKPLAGRIADYLKARRARRLGLDQADSETDKQDRRSEKPQGRAKLAIAFTSLGLLLGSGVGFIVAQFVDDEVLPQPVGQAIQHLKE